MVGNAEAPSGQLPLSVCSVAWHGSSNKNVLPKISLQISHRRKNITLTYIRKRPYVSTSWTYVTNIINTSGHKCLSYCEHIWLIWAIMPTQLF